MEYVRCKVCGYITTADKIGDCCPACGVAAKMMEPYTHNVSEKRLKILKLDIHPVIVHVPQALAALLVVFAAIMLIAGPSVLKNRIYDSTVVLAVILPSAVIAAISSGIFDGKTRFKRVSTPVLKKKMVFGILFLLASGGAAVFSLLTDIHTIAYLIAVLILELVSLGAATLLGLLGSGLINSVMPGK